MISCFTALRTCIAKPCRLYLYIYTYTHIHIYTCRLTEPRKEFWGNDLVQSLVNLTVIQKRQMPFRALADGDPVIFRHSYWHGQVPKKKRNIPSFGWDYHAVSLPYPCKARKITSHQRNSFSAIPIGTDRYQKATKKMQ